MRLSLLIVPVVFAIAMPAHARAQGQSVTGQVVRGAPADRPVAASADCQWNALVKAMEPHVAQARETWPAAKRRFIAHVEPVRPMFVTTQLRDPNGRREQVFVAVDSVDGGKIYGRLASEVGVVQGYRYHEPVSFDDGDLIDWMFANPDGSEEGNVVGKFLDTYTPAGCRQ